MDPWMTFDASNEEVVIRSVAQGGCYQIQVLVVSKGVTVLIDTVMARDLLKQMEAALRSVS